MLVNEVFYKPFGSAQSVHDFISSWKTPDEDMGKKGSSYLTFFSSGGLIFGIVNIIGNLGTMFCDQAYWQSSVAAKPLQGIWGFISGSLVWFTILFTLATTMGLAYLGLSSAQGAPMLTDEDMAKGLAAPLVAQRLLGTTGKYAMLFLILVTVLVTFLKRNSLNIDRPPLDIVIRKFCAAKITSYIAAVCLTILFVVIWPGSMLTIDIFEYTQFNVWTVVSRGWPSQPQPSLSWCLCSRRSRQPSGSWRGTRRTRPARLMSTCLCPW